MSVSMFGKLVQQDISMAATDWGWGYNSQVVNEGDLLKCTLTGQWGALSTGWDPTTDLSGWDKIIFIVENMSGCDGEWFKLKAYLRDNTESEANQMEGLLGNDAPDNQQNYLVIDLHQQKACDLTHARILAVQCQTNGAVFKISRVYLEKEVIPVTYPYAVRYADEMEYPYLKVGDRLAEGTKLIGADTLKIRFKASRHKTSGTLATSDLEISLAEFDSIGAHGLVGGGFGQLNPVNAAGENGIEWEVVSIGTGPLCTGPLELVGVGYPYALNYVDEVACIDVKAGDSVSAGAKINGVGYIRFIGGSYKLNGVLQNDDSEVLEIVDYPYFGYPYCNANGEFVVGDKVFTSCDPAGNALTQWLCFETGPLETGPLGTGPLGTGPLAFKGTGPLAPAVEREVTKVGFNFPTADCPADNNIQMAGTFAEGTMNMEKIIATGWFISYDFVNAAADETFKFRDATNNDMVLCKFIPANGNEEGKWVQAIFTFGNYWSDDSWHGTPCKYIELDVSDANQYAWKQGMPEPDPESALENISADVKAVKVVRDGQVYILRGDKTFNLLGAEVK